MSTQTVLVIVVVLSAALFAYEVRVIAPLAWHSGDQQIVLNSNTDR